ncbi:anthrone oxygenase family protein [Chitinophaga lutea]
MPQLILILATLFLTLSAGLFFAFSVAVNPGLGRLPDEGYMAAMQSINRAILNPVFFIMFFGALLLPVWAAWLHRGTPAGWWLLAAAILYAVTVFGVTVAGNVPLNNALEAFRLDGADAEELRLRRAAFERPWNMFHTIRTTGNVVAAFCMIMALLRV